MTVEVLLQSLICIVYTKLFKTILIKRLKTIDIKDTYGSACPSFAYFK
eukprot:Gb_06926 [translate_table: standard]